MESLQDWQLGRALETEFGNEGKFELCVLNKT